MSRTLKNRKLDSRTSRRAVPQGKSTQWIPISRGRALGYRRGRKGGTWVARFDAADLRREQKLGEADDVLDADGVQILDFAQALQKASKFFLSALAQATGEMTHTGPYTVELVARDYLKSLENRGAPDHRGAVYDFNRNIIPQIGALDVSKLTRAKLETWRSKLAERPRLPRTKSKTDATRQESKAPTEDEKRQRRATTNRTVRRLVAALNYALETGKINVNPMNWRLRPFENVEIARAAFLSEGEQQQFVSACAGDKYFQNLVLAALHTGCRYSELSRLRVKDFVPSGPSIFVETSKAGKSRHVFLDKEGEEFFKSKTQNRIADAVMLPRSDGKVWSKDNVKKPMRRALKAAGMSRIQFHSLRHSFATRLLTRGITIQVAAKMLGHSSVRMIERNYGHLTDDHMREQISGLPGAGLNHAAKTTPGSLVSLPMQRRTA